MLRVDDKQIKPILWSQAAEACRELTVVRKQMAMLSDGNDTMLLSAQD